MKNITFNLIIVGLMAIGVISNYLVPQYMTYIAYILVGIIIGLIALPELVQNLKSRLAKS